MNKHGRAGPTLLIAEALQRLVGITSDPPTTLEANAHSRR